MKPFAPVAVVPDSTLAARKERAEMAEHRCSAYDKGKHIFCGGQLKAGQDGSYLCLKCSKHIKDLKEVA